MIKEVKKYTDDKGRSVTAYIPLNMDGDAVCKEKFIAYEGQVGIPTPMGVHPVRFPFPEDYTLEKCYEEFEGIAMVEVEKVIEEAEKRQKEAEEKAKDENLILTPGQAAQEGQGQSIPFPQG